MNVQSSTATEFVVPNVMPIQIENVTVDPPILQAPMAAFTNDAFRQIVREYGGAGSIATEMIHASGSHPLRKDGVLMNGASSKSVDITSKPNEPVNPPVF